MDEFIRSLKGALDDYKDGYYDWDYVRLAIYIEEIPTIINALEYYRLKIIKENNNETSREESQEES